jgi:hypothetical protein
MLAPLPAEPAQRRKRFLHVHCWVLQLLVQYLLAWQFNHASFSENEVK